MNETGKIEDYIELYKEALPIKPLKPFGWDDDYLKRTGIYFLFKDDVVVYVGKSNYSIQQRLFTHKLNKKFDYAKYIQVNRMVDLNNAEYVYINLFNPFYNKTLKNNDYFDAVRSGYKAKKDIVDSSLKNIDKVA